MYLNRLMASFLALALLSCSGTSNHRRQSGGVQDAPVIEGVSFVYVPSGSLPFNSARSTLRGITGSVRQFEVIQGGFWISEKPVSPELFQRYAKGSWPSSGVSYQDAESFLDRMAGKTGVPVVLPSEAMYEAALLSDALTVSREWTELVSDGWSENRDAKDVEVNWCAGEGNGSMVVSRKPLEREPVENYRRRPTNVFHICVRKADEDLGKLVLLMDLAGEFPPEDSDGKNEVFTVGEVSFTMKAVPGGTLQLGATQEQERYAGEDERPVREVELDSFKISETEVTQELWEAVMGGLPAGNAGHHPKKPVAGVNWYDAQRFVWKLSLMTGRPFRIPSGDEWEYAARGGAKSRHFVFSGSNHSADVASCIRYGEKAVVLDVKSLSPNELGLYDMSGNLWEWVRQCLPDGSAVLRGGSYQSKNTACRVSNLQPMEPGHRKGTFGFRIAL